VKASDRLDSLRRAAEVASSAMRDVAQNLEEIADGLPAREANRKLLLTQNAERLNSAARHLIAEANLGTARSTRFVARAAAIGLLGAGALLRSIAGGAAEGVTAARVEAAIEANQRALERVEEVEAEAQAEGADLPHDVHDDIEKMRQLLLGLGLRLEEATGGDSRRIVRDNGLEAPDLGVPNARQRLVCLGAALDDLRTLLPAVAGEEAELAAQVLDLVEQRIAEARLDVELLAVTDDSLYPPQAPPAG
jgi:hypothetical protein